MSKEAMKQALEALKNNRRKHYGCEDTWYSCPKHEDGCFDEDAGSECNCGADKANVEIDAAIKVLQEAPPEQQDIWILTSERNEYDQYGEYFEAVFIGKPTAEQIHKVCGLHKEYGKEEVKHILSGGGRVKWEDHWYNLRKEEAAHGITKGDET